MKNLKLGSFGDFYQIVSLIDESRNRAFRKVNEELVLLYFKIGGIVSRKVADKTWGDSVVNELAQYILKKYPGLSGFNRRGLYRMKQFYETYSTSEFVSTLLTQIHNNSNNSINIVTNLLSQIQWSSHLHLMSKTKSTEEKLFYLKLSISEKWSVRDLERQSN